MCGIAGWISYNEPVNTDVLVRMRDIMSHRGPDGKGLWLNPSKSVGFAHRRLSIIDLSDQARQPMNDESGKICIVFNGEIYNHRHLRKELKLAGCVFQTSHSDTECLLLGYLTWGINKLVSKLVGMFAFAIHDQRSNTVTLVRDRVGVKPLYYSRISGGLIFSSELKSLLVHPALTAELDSETLNYHLCFRSLPSPYTLFKGVECLAPSQILEIPLDSPSGIRKRTYWDPVANSATAPPTLQEANERLAELLEESVDFRLESDVPVGLFLSGGVDSALLLQLMSKKLNNTGTYTVGYPGHNKYNESSEAAQIAHAAGSDHHEIGLSESDFINAMNHVAYHQDEPISAPVCTSVFYLAREASRTGRKVILAGEGADELFIGYRTWRQARDLQQRYDQLAGVFGPSCFGLPGLLSKFQLSYNSRATEVLSRLSRKQPLFWGGGIDFGEKAKADLLGLKPEDDNTYDQAIEPIRNEYLKSGDPADITQWMSYVDLRFRLPQLMLPRLDKMGMAFSIEGRVPYLDHRIIEFVFGLPAEWRGSVGRITKPLLKQVAARHLPDEFVNKKKRGFQAPVTEWKSTTLGKTYLPELKKFARQTSLFNSSAITRLTESNNDRLYFSLVNFMLWYCVFIDNVIEIDLESLSTPFGMSRHS